MFRRIAAPGADGLSSSEDLVAIWRSRRGSRFQNYRATLTILDAPVISRSWLDSVVAGHPDEQLAPPAWSEWVSTGRYRPLRAASVLSFRTPADQLPTSQQDRELLAAVYGYFEDGYAFEPCAAALWQMSAGRVEYTMTRPSRDGGRDAIGTLLVGPTSDAVRLEFALEAKHYAPSSGVGVRELARLISRIRHRMFGILVTTSYLDRQAYEELRADGHPIVVMSGKDITEVLRANGLATPAAVRQWLAANFARGKESREVRVVHQSTRHSRPATQIPDDARALLRGLVGREIRTLTGRPNRVLRLESDDVWVATRRSPQGRRVRIADVQSALSRLLADGEIEISVPNVGYRSAFVGAVLATLPGVTTSLRPRTVRISR